MKYRKKPVVIEAFEMTPSFWTNQATEYPIWAVLAVSKGTLVLEDGVTVVKTLEDGKDGKAKHVADWGDYLIQGVQGELYFCKPDIFHMTYEAVE